MLAECHCVDEMLVICILMIIITLELVTDCVLGDYNCKTCTTMNQCDCG